MMGVYRSAHVFLLPVTHTHKIIYLFHLHVLRLSGFAPPEHEVEPPEDVFRQVDALRSLGNASQGHSRHSFVLFFVFVFFCVRKTDKTDKTDYSVVDSGFVRKRPSAS